MRMKQIKAFTLVELLIVMAIIGMLIAIAIWGIGLAQQGARNTQRSEVASELVAAFANFYGKYGAQPTSVCFGKYNIGPVLYSASDAIMLTDLANCNAPSQPHAYSLTKIPGAAIPSTSSTYLLSESHIIPSYQTNSTDTLYVLGYISGSGGGLKICAALEGGGYADMGDPHNASTACP